jgi:hypothetical protein
MCREIPASISSADGLLPAIKTQLYSVAPWAAAFGFSMLIATLSDKFRHRYIFAMIPMLIAMGGFGILLNVHGVAHRHVQYGALFMVTGGCYSSMAVVVCWYAMNLSGHRRRGVGTAWQIGFGNSKLQYPRHVRGVIADSYNQLVVSLLPIPS